MTAERRDGFAVHLEQLAKRPMPEQPLLGVEEESDYPHDLTAAAQVELEHLWHDLHNARQVAVNGVWSIQCENLAYRIVMLSRLAGALSADHVQVDVVLDGLYERLHREARIEYPPIDWDGVRETAAHIAASAAGVSSR